MSSGETPSGPPSPGESRPPVGKRTAWVPAAFHHRNFRLFWFGQLVSLVGTWMQSVAQSWLVLQLTDSAFQVGLVSAMQFAPVMILGLVGGVVADRSRKRRLIMATQATAAVQALVLGSLVVSGHVQVWHVMVLASILGLVNAFDIPARQAFVVEMVGREDLLPAIALNSSAFNSARIVGPAVGGLLIAAYGVGPVFLINSASYGAVLFSLFLIRESHLHVHPKRARGPLLQSLRVGIAYVRANDLVLVATLLVGSVAILAMNYSVILPVMARDVFDIGSEGFGLLMASLGIGSVLAGLFLAYKTRLDPRRILVMGAVGMALCELAFAASPRFKILPLSFLFLLGAGFFAISMTATANSTIQKMVPDELRGRVMSVYVTVFVGSVPIGSLFAGTLARKLGAPMAMTIGALGGLCAAAWAFRRLRRSGAWVHQTSGPDLFRPAEAIVEGDRKE